MSTYERKYSLAPRSVPRVETAHRRIVTALPVPESVPILEDLERLEPSSMQGQPPVLIDRSEGWYVHDKWGNRWLERFHSTRHGRHPQPVYEARGDHRSA